ncbi:hypothetical protein [Aureimonas sp. D3]|uniref:hypothetical protein n=1 Tax=Aureimonas sp. D3 TaxID=1638164 RepID=UPI000782E23B|nr:hypothetical protein [Aureimonas sp. D3]
MDEDWRLKLLFPNLVYTSTLAGGRWKAGDLSRDALYDRVLGHVARTASAAPEDTQLVVELDRARRVGGLAILNHNMSPAATIILQGYRDRAMTDPVFNGNGAPEEVYPVQYRWGDVDFGEPNWWTRKPLAEDIGRVTTLALVLLPKPKIGLFWRVQCIDPNNPAKHLDLGKVFLGPSFLPSSNYAYGASLSVRDESRVSQSIGGTRFYDERAKRRVFAFGFQDMDEGREFSRFFDLIADAGITREMIVIPDPSDKLNLQRRSFCGVLREPTQLEQAVYARLNANFVAEEDI